jgi:hypothetical protein
MKITLINRFSLLVLCVVLCGCSAVPIPPKSSISIIEICSGRHNCNNGKYKIEDVDSIGLAIDKLLPFKNGWQTETQMALTTGWFTYPTPEDDVLFRNRDGKAVFVIWFGTGWMGAAVYDGNSQDKYFRKTTAEEVKSLRAALRITLRSSGTPAGKPAAAP